MNAPFLIDILLAVLLSATLFYAVSLRRSLLRMRDGREELSTLIKDLNDSVARADAAIRGMKDVAGEYDDVLRVRVQEARKLADELEVINQASDGLATRLERAANKARGAETGQLAPELMELEAELNVPAPAPVPARREPVPARPRSAAERDLIEAIQTLRQGLPG